MLDDEYVPSGPVRSWPASRDLWRRTARSLAGGVSTNLRASMAPHPLFFRSGKGPRLTDVDGNVVLDYVLGWGPVIVGHAHPRLSAAVVDQVARGATYGAGHEREASVAEKVIDRIPGVERILWTNTGSEANQIALRLARAVTGRRRFVKFGGHYHGWTDAFLVGYRPDAQGELGLGSRGQGAEALESAVLVPWGDLDGLTGLLESREIAAVFLEPALVNSGLIEPPPGFLSALRELCDRTGTILVFDEVITGFRIARGGAVERYRVRPDLVVLAKAIAGGYPLAAVAGRSDIVDEVTRGVVHAGTYNGNPVSLAAADATLDILAESGTYEDFDRRGAALARGIAEAFGHAGVAGAVAHLGPIVQVVPRVDEVATLDDFFRGDQRFYARLSIELLSRGVFVMPGGRWYISTAHTDADIDRTVDAVAESVAAVAGSEG